MSIGSVPTFCRFADGPSDELSECLPAITERDVRDECGNGSITLIAGRIVNEAWMEKKIGKVIVLSAQTGLGLKPQAYTDYLR